MDWGGSTGDGGGAPSDVVALTIGSGVYEFVSSTTSAGVVGVFQSGFYIGHGSAVMAVVDPSISSGPLHLKLKTGFEPPKRGTAVSINDDRMVVGPLHIDIASGQAYRPTIPRYQGGGAHLLAAMDAPPPADLQGVWTLVHQSIKAGELRRARDLVCGRGIGLTPEGDDVLAGALMVLTANRTLRPQLAKLVEDAPTTDLSRAFLRWAAAGESIEAIHDLVWAAHHRDLCALTRAQRQVRAVGGSTGNAMLAGIKLASLKCQPDARCW